MAKYGLIQNKYWSALRIYGIASLIICALCTVAVFVPMVEYIEWDGQAQTMSVYEVLSQIEPSFLWMVQLAIYAVLCIPFAISVFCKNIRMWPAIIAAVASIVFFAMQILWVIIMVDTASNYTASFPLTFLGGSVTVVQVAQIVNLFVYAKKVKKAK